MIPSTQVSTVRGSHEYEMHLDEKSVRLALDHFYAVMNARHTNYRILGTYRRDIGRTSFFVVQYMVI